jgi:hypothetical protein
LSGWKQLLWDGINNQHRLSGQVYERNVETERVSDSMPLVGLVLAHVTLFSGQLSPKNNGNIHAK